MWKITTRGFTLQEVLILAAMNVATAVLAAEKRGQTASQKSTKRRCKWGIRQTIRIPLLAAELVRG
jgi:hypothetical protein